MLRHVTQWELGICYEFFREGSATEAKLLTNLKGLNDAREADPSLLMDDCPPFVDPVMFQTESTIANAALKTRWSSGPSGLDAYG